MQPQEKPRARRVHDAQIKSRVLAECRVHRQMPWLFLPTSLFRWIVMRTSKIPQWPQWPQWVEDECAIDPNDPWVAMVGIAQAGCAAD